MNRTQGLLILLGVLVLAAAGDLLWHYPRLPEQVATKFTTSGAPTAWSAKATFLTVQIVMLLVLVSLALAGRFLLPLLPPHWINIPHRAYWLAPERMDFTRRAVGELVLAICSAQLAFVTALTHLTMRANLAPSPALGREPLWLVGGFLAVIGALVIGAMRVFRRPR
jgi:uncharacterized membrane protein